MQVLMVSQFYPPVVGGQEAHVRNLAQALEAHGHAVEVATIAVDGTEGTVLDGAVPVHRIRAAAQFLPKLFSDPERPHAMPIIDPKFRAGIGRLLQGGRFDVLHAHDWSINSAFGPARRWKTPVVLTQHDYSHICATKRLMRGDEVCPGPAPVACIRCASSQYGPIIGPGVAAANFATSGIRRRHVDAFIPVSSAVAISTGLSGHCEFEVIPNFIPDSLVLDRAVPQPDGPIVFVGDMSPDKGIDVLIAAYLQLSEAPPLVLAGRVLTVLPSPLPERIELLGVVDHDAVTELVRSASVVAVPSIVPDCCPTVVLEAMAAGRPVVAAASGGIVDQVEDGVTGLLVPAGDPVALGAALISILNDVDGATAMGEKALERVRGFTASAVVARLEAVYERLISGAMTRT